MRNNFKEWVKAMAHLKQELFVRQELKEKKEKTQNIV